MRVHHDTGKVSKLPEFQDDPELFDQDSPRKTIYPFGSLPSKSVLAEAEGLINGVKRENYGDAKESFANIWTGWEPILASAISGPEKVALCMDWLKTCRYLTNQGRDDLIDKAGYTGLAARLGDIDD